MRLRTRPAKFKNPRGKRNIASADELRTYRIRDHVAPYAAEPAMIDALWPPKPKLLLITTRSFRSRCVLGV